MKKGELAEAKRELKEQIQEVVQAYVLGFDPCKYCKRYDKTKKENYEICVRCCHYYASKFEVNDGN